MKIRKPSKNHNIHLRQEKKKELLLSGFAEQGESIAGACEYAGVDKTTFYAWYNGDKKFADKIDSAKDHGRTPRAEDSLYKQLLAGNMTAIIFYLGNRAKDRWQSIQHIEHRADNESLNLLVSGIGKILKGDDGGDGKKNK